MSDIELTMLEVTVKFELLCCDFNKILNRYIETTTKNAQRLLR